MAEKFPETEMMMGHFQVEKIPEVWINKVLEIELNEMDEVLEVEKKQAFEV